MRDHAFSIRFLQTIIFLAASATAWSQVTGSGTIQGSITDASGAVVPGASVTATNVATGVETERTTTPAGFYVLSPLPAGEYTVRVSAAGFQTLSQQHIVVDATANVGLNLELKVGSASETVTVEGRPAALHTEDATLGGTVGNQVYDALPLSMGTGVPRDPTQFIALVAGVAAVATQASGPSYTSFNGAHEETNELYLEGVAMSFPNQQGDTRNISLAVSVEAVDQFQVAVNGQKAMYQGQGMHNYVLKSGTNSLHGTAFEYFRNTSLDARGFFSSFVPLDHQNEFGGNIGGPIKKDKMFFFANYSGYYYKTATAPVYLSIPTLAERSGDFSGVPATIYDPASNSCVGAICSKQPFSGNLIPATRISPVAKSFQSYMVAPTTSTLLNNYLSTLPKSLHTNNVTSKVDLNFDGNNRFFGLFARGKYSTDYTGNLTATGTALPLPYNSSAGVVQEVPTIAQAHFTHLFSSSLINDASFGLMRIWIPIESNTAAGAYPAKAGLTGLPPGNASLQFPLINFTGPNAPINWATTGPFNEAENNFTFQDNIQWVHGRHAITFGGQIQSLQDNRTPADTGSNATFTFSNNETAGFSPTGTLVTTTGNAYASYLLGAVDSAAITYNSVVVFGARYRDYSAFVQDDWRVNSRLTVNAGLRYDILGPSKEVLNRMSFLDPNMPNPAASGYPGALQFAGHGSGTCNCDVPYKTHYKNFEPRVGIAWSLDHKTVIRSSFGVNVSHGAAGVGGNGPNAGTGLLGYNASGTFSSPATGLPAFYWDLGVPSFVKPPFLNPGYGVGFTTANPTGASSLTYASPDLAAKPPYYFNWSFGIQRQLTNEMTFGAAYSASVGHFLPGDGDIGIWSNSMLPKYLALGSLLGAQATPANIAAAKAIVPGVALPFANFQGTIAQMLKPFPQYSGLTYFSGDLGNSTYHSLQLTFERRFARGLTSQVAYTWSKELDNVAGTASHIGAVGGNRNPFAGGLDKGLGAVDRAHVFHATFLWELPFGKGHAIGSGNAFARGLASGWQLSGIITFTTGIPLAIIGSGCNTPGIVSTCIASYNPSYAGPVRITGSYGSGNALSPGAVSYFAKNAFADPAAYTFGTLPRSAPYGLFAPSLLDESLSLRREIAITERLKLAITGEVFNLTNSVYFGAPGNNIDSANFGQVTTSANLPRKLQLNARITF
jgi:hypothetical protein